MQQELKEFQTVMCVFVFQCSTNGDNQSPQTGSQVIHLFGLTNTYIVLHVCTFSPFESGWEG